MRYPILDESKIPSKKFTGIKKVLSDDSKNLTQEESLDQLGIKKIPDGDSSVSALPPRKKKTSDGAARKSARRSELKNESVRQRDKNDDEWRLLLLNVKMNVHPYYMHMSDDDRDCEFALAYTKVAKFKGGIPDKMDYNLRHLPKLGPQTKTRKSIRRGRLLADSNGAFYPEWIEALWSYHQNKKYKNANEPNLSAA